MSTTEAASERTSSLDDPIAPLARSGMSPAEIVAAVAADAEIATTPCGDGRLVWRRWGRGRPLVLAHGGSGSWTHWIKQIPVLKQHYEVWAIDLPGLGDSAMPAHPHTPESSGEAVAAGLKSLIPRERRAHVVAFSFGAHVSTHAMVRLGDWVSDFTITGCAALGFKQGPGIEFPKERSGMSEEERMGVHRGLLEILMFKENDRIDPLAIYLQSENIRRARFRSRPFARTDEIRVKLPEVVVPVRAIWGAEDQTAWPSVEARYDALRDGHPELVTRTVPDAGHWVMYEQPAAYTAALLEVLALE
ncbi:alpha/beta hydrolase [Hyphomicrobium sp. CS1BSMeth3]|uniref:alpha/beta fold hydrolase n=1 Tax=Hyphomicrobium sp. CS1BSMeth3 TaxID=1892844 RepID=UPI0009FAE22C|nr:alpha/beta hydrolase [Hyphomicrobium sp. CS1BSMeth3]